MKERPEHRGMPLSVTSYGRDDAIYKTLGICAEALRTRQYGIYEMIAHTVASFVSPVPITPLMTLGRTECTVRMRSPDTAHIEQITVRHHAGDNFGAHNL